MSELSKSTLFHYFAGHSTPLEKKIIEEWLTEGKNVELYYEWMEEWEREHPQFVPSTDDAFDHFVDRIHDQSKSRSRSQVSRANPSFPKVWLRIAASVSILVVLTFTGYIMRDFVQFKSYRTGSGEVQTVTLEDGSQVTLNANSLLRVPRFGFGTDSRDVLIKGEAEFIVEHTKDHKKFVVHTPDHLEVEVVGTEFIVFSRDRGSKVVLTKGEVLLRSPDESIAPLTVRPGDIVTVQGGTFDIKEHQPVQIHAAWKDHKFVFDQTSLKEVALQLQERLDVRMVFADSMLAKRQITGTIQAENPDEFLDVIARLLDAEIHRNGNEVLVEDRR